MKVCILGPVFTTKYFGGVANFTENLADAFNELGDEIFLITDYTEREYTFKNTKIIGICDKPSKKNIRYIYKTSKTILEINPDIVITSVEYGFVNKLLKNKGFKGKLIYFLHGYPIFKHKIFHNILLTLGTKYISKYSDVIISNSEFTSTINETIYGIKSNKIINMCLGYDFIDELKEQSKNYSKEKGTILYVGRLVKEKNVDLLIKAYSMTNNAKKLVIVGDGPEYKNLKELSKQICNKEIVFEGKVPPRDTVKYYLTSELFISLCPHESYGIVYLEAIATNCKVICPRTGGHLDTIFDYLDIANLVSSINLNEIVNAIDNSLSKSLIDNYYSEDILRKFSYENIVLSLKNYINDLEIS